MRSRGRLSLDNLEAQGREQGLTVEYTWPGRRYSEFTAVIDRLHPELAQASGEKAVTETSCQGRRLVVAHNPDRAVSPA